jgi:hypothetical protein
MEVIKRINSETLVLKEFKYLLGKKVRINIEVIEERKKQKKGLKPLGCYKLGKELDAINIRDLAYDKT